MNLPYFGLLVVVACAIFFFRVAQYERLSPWAWSVGSIALSGIVLLLGWSTGVMLLTQVGLFLALWWHNAQRVARK